MSETRGDEIDRLRARVATLEDALRLVDKGFRTKRLKDATLITMTEGEARMDALSDIVRAALSSPAEGSPT